jgi:hypothetical protein
MHSGCLHWQGVFGLFFASAHVVLQCFLPLAGLQLQPGRSHFCVVVINAPLLEHAFFRPKALLYQEYAPRSELRGA